MKPLTHWLIRRAARSAPGALSQRLEEEWLADLAARPSRGSRLRFAIGCCWATQVIAFEHGGSQAVLAPNAAGPKLLAPFLNETSGLVSRRSMTLVLVVGLHIALFYGLLVGLDINVKKWVIEPLQNRSVPQPLPDLSPPPTPPPTLSHPSIIEVPPDFPPIGDPTDDKLHAVPLPPGGPPQVARPQTPPHVVSRVSGGPGVGFPATDDFYPSAAKRLEEQGIATVHVCVDAHGRLMSDPTTEQGSGSARLDAGALQLAKAGSGHYRASTEDGRPVDGCYAFRVRFELR